MDTHQFHPLLRSVILLAVCLVLSACLARPPEGMALVPEGPFVMGTDAVALEKKARALGITKPWVMDATPAHEVRLEAFYIQQHEVSNAAYLRFVEAEKFPVLPHWPEGRPAPEQMRLPVVFVNWHEAQAYCRWIGGRLPVEAEWEKAARGTDGRIYPWGNQFEPGRANLGGQFEGPLPVGSFPQGNSPYKVSDMIGNVWEWTDSWYRPYPRSQYSTPDYKKTYRVVRSSSWSGVGHFPPRALREVMAAQAQATYRLFFPPEIALEDIGFRCVKPLRPSGAD